MSAQAGVPVGQASRWVVMVPSQHPGPSGRHHVPDQRRCRATGDIGQPVCYSRLMADAPPDESEPAVDVAGGSAPPEGGESALTVIVAFGANLLIAVAKTVAAMITASASMLAEAAHS